MKQEDCSPKNGQTDQPAHSAGRKLAEWVSLGLSALVILALVGYLAVEAFRKNEPFIPVEVQALLNDTREVEGKFILPVKVTNRGAQTLRDLKVELRYEPPGSAAETADVLIDYLGERSEQTAYFYFAQHPNALKLEARAVSYIVD